MNGHEERYSRSNDAVARVIAFLSPYLFWGTLGVIVGVIVLIST